jgi:hypothetical protein
LADGAPWIWERLAWVERRVGVATERVVRVLDWCHAVHHVSLALEALALPAAERQRWYRHLRGLLRRGQVARRRHPGSSVKSLLSSRFLGTRGRQGLHDQGEQLANIVSDEFTHCDPGDPTRSPLPFAALLASNSSPNGV